MAKFTALSFDSTGSVYPIKSLLLQTEVHCIVVIKFANFGANAHKPELYLLSFGHFLFSIKFEKATK